MNGVREGAPGSAGQNEAHTSWETEHCDDGSVYVVDTDGEIVCVPVETNTPGNERDAARFRLIAAAPELYAFAKALDASWSEAFPSGPDGDCSFLGGVAQMADEHVALWRLCRIALAKAEGRS